MRLLRIPNTRLRTKILGNILFLILSLLLASGLGVLHLTRSAETVELLSRSFENRLMYSTDMRSLVQQMNYLEKELLNTSKDGQADTFSEIKDRFDEVEGFFAAYQNESDGSQKDKITEIAAALPQLKQSLQELATALEQGTEIKTILEDKIIPASGNAYIYLNSMHQNNLDGFRAIVATAKERQNKARLQVLIVCLTALALGLFFSSLTTRKVMALERTEGMIGSFRKGVASLEEIANTVSDRSSELAETGSEQARAAQGTASAMEQISATVTRTAENASRLGRIAQENDALAQEGRIAATKMQEGMELLMEVNRAIEEHLKKSHTETQQLVTIIKDISTKTSVINDIVFQTRLLSFNASVEAARAGEHGRGFSVVAEEVGNLAGLSGRAAADISVLIEKSTTQTNEVLALTQQRFSAIARDLQTRMAEGKSNADTCLKIIETMYQKATEASSMSAEMSQACSEQAHAVREVNVTVIELDKTADQVQKASEVTKAEAASLESVAGDLSGLVVELERTLQSSKEEPSTRDTRQGVAQAA